MPVVHLEQRHDDLNAGVGEDDVEAAELTLDVRACLIGDRSCPSRNGGLAAAMLP